MTSNTERDVTRGTGEGPDRLKAMPGCARRGFGNVPFGGHGLVGRAQPVDPGARGGVPDRSAVVAADRERHQSAGYRSRAAATRPARRSRRVLRVTRRPEQPIVGAGSQRELGAVRLADQDGTRRPQPGHDLGVGRRDVFGEHEAAGRRAHPRGRDRVLHRERHPRERSGIVAARDERVDPRRGGPRRRGSDGDDRVGRVLIDARPARRRRSRARRHFRGEPRPRSRTRRHRYPLHQHASRMHQTTPAAVDANEEQPKESEQTPAILYE